MYCQDGKRRGHYDGPVSSDFPGHTFRARDVMGKRGRFTGFPPAASGKAIARMSQEVRGWRLRRRPDRTLAQLAAEIGPVIGGWMAWYGRFRKSELYPLLARINHYLRKWLQAKYRTLRGFKVMLRARERVITQYPGLFPHWQWITSAKY